MLRLTAALVAANLSLSTFALADAGDRVNSVLSLLGQRGVEDIQIVSSGEDTVVRGRQGGRVVEILVRREATVEQPWRLRRHSGLRHGVNDDANTARTIARVQVETTGGARRDGLKDLPEDELDAIYDGADSDSGGLPFDFGGLDMGKGPRSGPALPPAQ